MATIDRIEEVLMATKDLMAEKNKRYGNSALEPIGVFSKLPSRQGILLRLDDKIKRVKNSDDLRINDISDVIGYCTLLLIDMEVRRQDILDLID